MLFGKWLMAKYYFVICVANRESFYGSLKISKAATILCHETFIFYSIWIQQCVLTLIFAIAFEIMKLAKLKAL